MIKSVLIPFFLFCLQSVAQTNCIPYFRELSIAKYENFKGDTEQAIKRFEKANKEYSNCTEAESKLEFIKMYVKLNNQKEANRLLVEEFKKGYKFNSLQYQGISKNNLGAYYDSLRSWEDSLHQLFYTNIDYELLLFIHELYTTDQQIQKLPYPSDSLKVEMCHQVFRNNTAKLAAYVTENGVVEYKKLGHQIFGIALVFRHHILRNNQDYENRDKLIVKYSEGIKNGYCSPSSIVQLYDNKEEILGNNEPQLFGKYYNSETKEFLPFKNIDSVDSLRLSFGMNTLKEFAEMKGLHLPRNYPK